MPTFAFPSQSNVFLPSHDATGNLVVAYSRNPKDFALNKYITITPVKKSVGYYLRINTEVAARVINSSNLAEFIWNDGDEAPKGDWNLESFAWLPYGTSRYLFPFSLGYKANDQADFKLLQAQSEFMAQDAMTARSLKVISTWTDTANHDTGHYDTAANWGGGYLDSGTPTSPVLKKALNAMAKKIHKDTLGRVQPKDLMLVMNPDLADAIGRSQEVHAYLKESPSAIAQVRGDSPSQNGVWGMPDSIYGYPVVVEDTVRVSNKKGATRSADYALAGTKLGMLSRKGGLTSLAGGPSFSSVHVFAYEEMTVETKDDPDNRRIKSRVVEDYDVRMVAPSASALCTSAIA